MLSKLTLALAGALTVLPQFVHAADAARCVDVSVPQRAVAAQKGKWIELTPERWQFLRGIYAMNPLTPPGLPYGDKAALAEVDENSGGLVFFIDGDRACTPMAAPKAGPARRRRDGEDQPRGKRALTARPGVGRRSVTPVTQDL